MGYRSVVLFVLVVKKGMGERTIIVILVIMLMMMMIMMIMAIMIIKKMIKN